jgi:hypothetical protein
VSTLAAGRQCQPVYENFIDKVSTLAAPVRGDVEGSDGWNVEGAGGDLPCSAAGAQTPVSRRSGAGQMPTVPLGLRDRATNFFGFGLYGPCGMHAYALRLKDRVSAERLGLAARYASD